MAKGIGVAGGIPVLLKVAKLEQSLDVGTGTPIVAGTITFDKQTDEVVLIYGLDPVWLNGNGLGTGTEVGLALSRDRDQNVLDPDDEDTMAFWHWFKSFVTSGMSIEAPNQLKTYPHPLITSKPQLRVICQVFTANWASGEVNLYVYYTTRVLDAEARRVLIGVE